MCIHKYWSEWHLGRPLLTAAEDQLRSIVGDAFADDDVTSSQVQPSSVAAREENLLAFILPLVMAMWQNKLTTTSIHKI